MNITSCRLLLRLFTVAILTGIFFTAAASGQESGATSKGRQYFEQGEKYFEDKEWKKAAKAYEQAAKLDSTDNAAFFNLGCAYYNSHQFTKAINAFQQALELNPNTPNVNEYLAKAETAKKAEKERQKAMWAGIAGALAAAAADSDEQSAAENSNQGGGGGETVVSNGRLPAGKYQCRTLMGSMIQERDSFHIYDDGTYQVDDQNNSRSPYSYDMNSGAIEWRGEGFSLATSSRYDAGRQMILIRLGNENIDCKIRG